MLKPICAHLVAKAEYRDFPELSLAARLAETVGWLPVDTRGHIAIGVVTAPEYLEHTLRAREPGRTSRLDSVVIGTDQVAAGGGDEHLAQAPADSLKRWPNENPEEAQRKNPV